MAHKLSDNDAEKFYPFFKVNKILWENWHYDYYHNMERYLTLKYIGEHIGIHSKILCYLNVL